MLKILYASLALLQVSALAFAGEDDDTVVFYQGSQCASEFGCSKDEPLGLVYSEKKYQRLDRCIEDGLEPKLSRPKVKEACDGGPAILTGKTAWIAKGVDPAKGELVYQMQFAYRYSLSNGSKGMTPWFSDKGKAGTAVNEVKASSIQALYTYHWNKRPEITIPEDLVTNPSSKSPTNRQITCSFNGSGYDAPSFGGGGYNKSSKDPYTSTGFESSIVDTVKSACSVCAGSTVEYHVPVNRCRFVGCFVAATGERIEVNNDIFNLLNNKCSRF